MANTHQEMTKVEITQVLEPPAASPRPQKRQRVAALTATWVSRMSTNADSPQAVEESESQRQYVLSSYSSATTMPQIATTDTIRNQTRRKEGKQRRGVQCCGASRRRRRGRMRGRRRKPGRRPPRCRSPPLTLTPPPPLPPPFDGVQ